MVAVLLIFIFGVVAGEGVRLLLRAGERRQARLNESFERAGKE